MDDICVITVDNLITLCKENNISTDIPIVANDEALDDFSLVRK